MGCYVIQTEYLLMSKENRKAQKKYKFVRKLPTVLFAQSSKFGLLQRVDTKQGGGGILRNMQVVIPGLCDAQIQKGVLGINKPNFRGSAFLKITNYHIADFNLFYMNIRENAVLRTSNYLKQ